METIDKKEVEMHEEEFMDVRCTCGQSYFGGLNGSSKVKCKSCKAKLIITADPKTNSVSFKILEKGGKPQSEKT